VYDGDPRRVSGAEILPRITHLEAIERGLKVMDTTALSLCMDNRLTIHVFELAEGNVARVVNGEEVGTIIATAGSVDGEAAGARPEDRGAGSADGEAAGARPEDRAFGGAGPEREG
jgi:aspartokinase